MLCSFKRADARQLARGQNRGGGRAKKVEGGTIVVVVVVLVVAGVLVVVVVLGPGRTILSYVGRSWSC